MALPWALQGQSLDGNVLEVGAGSGAVATQVLAAHPSLRLTVTDLDDAMIAAAGTRLAPFGDRATVRQSDATALPFVDDSFDAVLSFIMLHHVMAWEDAISEAVRVLRPDGVLIGYDVLATRPARWLHQLEGSRHRLVTLPQLRDHLVGLPVAAAILQPSLAGLVVRFAARKTGPPS